MDASSVNATSDALAKLQLLNQQLELTTKEHGEDSPEVGMILVDLAEVYTELGHKSAAEEISKRMCNIVLHHYERLLERRAEEQPSEQLSN